jgi:hypothetical protein
MKIMNLGAVRTLIEIKLKGIDIRNKNEGRDSNIPLNYELRGMCQLLYTLGYDLTLSINPYYFENGEPSKIVSIGPLNKQVTEEAKA